NNNRLVESYTSFSHMCPYKCISKLSSIFKRGFTDLLNKFLFILLIIHSHKLDVLVFANIFYSFAIYRVIHKLKEIFLKSILSALSLFCIKSYIEYEPVSLIKR